MSAIFKSRQEFNLQTILVKSAFCPPTRVTFKSETFWNTPVLERLLVEIRILTILKPELNNTTQSLRQSN